MEPVTITIPTEFLDAAMFAVAGDDARPELRGVFIDPRGHVVAANDRVATKIVRQPEWAA